MFIKPYVSWSEFNCFQNNIDEYHEQYILGKKIEPTPRMTYGNLIHKALERENFPIIEELSKNGFNAKDVRIAKEILKARRGTSRGKTRSKTR